MEIDKFLFRTRNANNVWFKKDCPDELQSMFELFDDLLSVYKGGQAPDELILIQTPNGCETSVVRADKRYLVIDIQQLSWVSQIGELVAFGEVDQESSISYFHQLWIDHSGSIDMLGDGEDGSPLRVRIKVKTEAEVIGDIREKFVTSDLMKHYANSKNFELFFEIIACFILAHELAHLQADALSSSQMKAFIRDIPNLIKTETPSTYLDTVLEDVDWDNLSSHQEVELYCDYLAFMLTEKVCVNLNFTSGDLLCIALSLLFNSSIFTLASSGQAVGFEDLKVRSSVIQKYGLSYVERTYGNFSLSDEDKVLNMLSGSGPPTENFERVLTLQDMYIRNVILSLIARGMLPVTDDTVKSSMRECFAEVHLSGSLAKALGSADDNPLDAILRVISNSTQVKNWYQT